MTRIIFDIGQVDSGATITIERVTKTPELQIGKSNVEWKYQPAPGWAMEPGERCAGAILKEDGTPSHQLFVLPVSHKKMKYAEALAWMDSVGGRPTRSEGLLIAANLRQHFDKSEWYWLGDEYSAGSAWCQYFGSGYQGTGDKNHEFLALAVRRLFL